jgi:hypothetical protein
MLKSWHEPHIVTAEGDMIATVYADKHRKLIAAAPELLAAAEQVATDLEQLTGGHLDAGCLDDSLATLRAAIAAAKEEK